MGAYQFRGGAVKPNEAYALAVRHAQGVFSFSDAVACTAQMLWHVLVWAAARASSLSHAVDRLYPGRSDQTFWNRLRASLSRRTPALERRLNALLRLPAILPRLVGRSLTVAVDYHAIPYYGAPKKVAANCGGASPNAAPPTSTPTPPCASSSLAGGTRWR
jgi:hypothetical protein